MNRLLRVTPHFTLGELVPADCELVPEDVFANLQRTCALAELVRDHLNLGLVPSDAYRPPAHNAAVGGAPDSDHLTGSAIDFRASAGHGMTWQANTKAAFLFIVAGLKGRFGQAILEDQRNHSADAEKLWIHLAIPTAKHPGFGDESAVLFSPAPHVYVKWPPAQQ